MRRLHGAPRVSAGHVNEAIVNCRKRTAIANGFSLGLAHACAGSINYPLRNEAELDYINKLLK
jgi:hypothetical protein